MQKVKAAIIGSGNIGTDLMYKIVERSPVLELTAMVGIVADSDGLAKARKLGIATSHDGIDGFVKQPEFEEVDIVFDASSARAHLRHHEVLVRHGKQLIDLTPAAVGPYNVPVVNVEQNLASTNVNMISCGGQATIPIVWAISNVAKVVYAEIVASISSRSAGPGTRANIDEFTKTTAKGIEIVGGARRAKAIIILNPAEPPILMRNTVFTLLETRDEDAVSAAVRGIVEKVQKYVPGYRLKQEVQFEHFSDSIPLRIPGVGEFHGMKAAVFLEVEGAGDYLPAYAGNLDIMTAAALATGERIAQLKFLGQAANV